eukprot:593571-Rhodomonas_salina.2
MLHAWALLPLAHSTQVAGSALQKVNAEGAVIVNLLSDSLPRARSFTSAAPRWCATDPQRWWRWRGGWRRRVTRSSCLSSASRTSSLSKMPPSMPPPTLFSFLPRRFGAAAVEGKGQLLFATACAGLVLRGFECCRAMCCNPPFALIGFRHPAC